MNNALGEMYTSLRRLHNGRIDSKTKEKLKEMISPMNHIVEDLDDEYKKMYSVMNMMDSDPVLRESMAFIMKIINAKRREMDEWYEIRQLIKRLSD